MNRTSILSFFVVAGATAVLFAGTAQSQSGVPKNQVVLQPTTPGTSQSGHLNVSGTARAGQFVGGGAGVTGVNATLLDGIDSTAFLQAVPNPLSLTGSFALGTIITGTNTSNSALATGVRGEASGASGVVYGVYGTTPSTSGRATAGFATATTGTNYGGFFDTNSVDGYGVFANSAGTYGMYGRTTQTSGTAYGVYGQSAAFTGYGIYGEATSTTGSNYGGRFNNLSTSGGGITAAALSSTGSTFAGRFENNSTAGRGVFGWALATSGTTYGVWGKTESPSGRAIFGDATGTGTAGYFQSAAGLGLFCSTSGTGLAMDISSSGKSALQVSAGVFGQSGDAAILIQGGFEGLRTNGNFTGVVGEGGSEGVIGYDTGVNLGSSGVWGSTNSQDGVGVRGTGDISAVDATGVLGTSSDFIGVKGLIFNTGSGTSYGVWGESAGATGRGVIGNVTSSAGVNYGVRGVNSNASGYAVYAAGDFGVSGTKAFVIDHPFDPTNKYLKHYCAEGAEPKNIYDGEIVTNAQGWATVTLPDYFTAININPKVQLTVDDTSEDFVMVKVVGGVQNGSFRIRTSKPNTKVYWEVKATRNDAWMKAHGAPVEVDKDPAEKGKYQHPELYGQPKEMGIDYDYRVERSKAIHANSKANPRARK